MITIIYYRQIFVNNEIDIKSYILVRVKSII